MHKWVNVTPDNGWARWVVFVQCTADEVTIGDQKLVGEW
jgi:hypothetical protein